MLVLSRRPHESVLIGDDIVVTICAIGPTAVSIGITAPSGVPILRDDAKERKPREFKRGDEPVKIKIFSS